MRQREKQREITQRVTTFGGTMISLKHRLQSIHKNVFGLLALFALAMAALTPSLRAQTDNASLSGLVLDKTGARVGKANILLVNDQTKDRRTTRTNRDGVFSLTAVPTGTYSVTVSQTGFVSYRETGIELHAGDERSLTDIKLSVGDEASVTVVASEGAIIDSGERSALISKEDIEHLSVESRDVTELLRILPGFALQSSASANGTGLSNASSQASPNVNVSSQLGSFAANGATEGGVGLISDGANIQDPGAAGAGTQTVNMDMVAEVKVSTSNFGAESSKGPIVVNAVGKSGSSSFHGTAYIISNISQFNSQDWLANQFNNPKPDDRYLFPGGNIGGPVLIPGTNFNHNRKLTFFAGGEDYVQRNIYSGGSAQNALRLTTVPTDRMRTGDFSASALSQFFNAPLNAAGTGLLGCASTPGNNGTLSNYSNFCAVPTGLDAKAQTITNGMIANLDPGGAAYLNLYPHANRTPQPIVGGNASDALNRIDTYLFNNNLWQARGRMDLAVSDNTKLYGVYNIEKGNSYNPFTLYYNPNYNQGILRDPSLIENQTNSQTGTFNFTHVFGPTLTNETYVSASYYFNPYFSQNQASQTASALGFPYGGLLQNGTKQLPMIGYGTALPLYQGPDFSLGSIYARKLTIDVGDNLTKVFREHTFKIGFYEERTANNQKVPFNDTQGSIAEYGTYAGFNVLDPNDPSHTPHATNPGNSLAAFLLGFSNNYNQQSSQPLQDMHFYSIDGFASDSWKVTKKLTLDLGVRFEHLGPWEDTHGTGLAVWDPVAYAKYQGSPTTVTAATLPGISWHALNSSIPVSGRPNVPVYYSPRVGFAYDVYGTGRTTIRGGWGAYRSPDSWNAYSPALGTAQGSYNVSVNNTTFRCIDAAGKGLLTMASTAAPIQTAPVGGAYSDCAGVTVASGATSTIAQGTTSTYAISATDKQEAVTYTYSATVSQQLSGNSLIEIAYAGNQGAHLFNSGLQNIDTVPQGALFGPDPNTQSAYYGQVSPPDSKSNNQVADYRPFPFYTSVNVIRHGLHTNYNALQTSWNKRTGHVLFGVNYTWSKALGDRAAGAGAIGDRTNEKNDVGILSFDRTNIFNATYTFILGSPFHGNRLIGGLVNSWEVSGISNFQSGANIQTATSSNFSLVAYTLAPNYATDSQSYLGTPDISLQPNITCDPSANRAAKQYIKQSCFALPNPGSNGPYNYPYARGPAYFHSDLSAQKSLRLGERKNLQLRVAGFNFLNHPLTSLVAAGSAQPLTLHLTGNPAVDNANSTFGIAQFKEGRRVMEVTLRYNF